MQYWLPASLLSYPIPIQPTALGSFHPCPPIGVSEPPTVGLPPESPRLSTKEAVCPSALLVSAETAKPCRVIQSYPSHSHLHQTVLASSPLLPAPQGRGISLLSAKQSKLTPSQCQATRAVFWDSKLPALSGLRCVLL